MWMVSGFVSFMGLASVVVALLFGEYRMLLPATVLGVGGLIALAIYEGLSNLRVTLEQILKVSPKAQ